MLFIQPKELGIVLKAYLIAGLRNGMVSANQIVEQIQPAAELIVRDEHVFILCYNTQFEDIMHKYNPESVEALSELRFNCETFCMFDSMIQNHWKRNDTLVGTGPGHGCHAKEDGKGTHCDDTPVDRNMDNCQPDESVRLTFERVKKALVFKNATTLCRAKASRSVRGVAERSESYNLHDCRWQSYNY